MISSNVTLNKFEGVVPTLGFQTSKNPNGTPRINRVMKLIRRIIFTLGCSLHFACAAEKPNIIFILVDDLGYADVGFNGSTYYETPAMDALAQDGLVLDRSYMYPTCSPSRTCYFTGKQSFRTGVYTVPVLEKGTEQENIFSRWTVGREHPIFMEQLAEAGYKGIHLGKWHIVGPYPKEEMAMDWPIKEKLKQPSPWDFSWVRYHQSPEGRRYYPEGRGFLKNVGGTYRGDPALEIDGYKNPKGGYFAPFGNPFIQPKADDHWLTDRLTDEAIAFMEEHKEGPFFINLNYYSVHRPLRKRTEERFADFMAKPGDPVTGQGMGKYKENMATMATMIESVDDNVRRVVEFLEGEGLRKNTLVIITSDNGHNGVQSSNHLLRGSKGYIYEGGIRVPTLFNWPGQVKARRSKTPVHVVDYFPTFLELAGIRNYHGVLDGESLTSLFKKDTVKMQTRPVFWHLASQWQQGTCSAVFKENHKLIQFLKDGAVELYDLNKDPKEEHNLANERPELAKPLLALLVDWRKSHAVPLPPESVLTH